MNRIPEWRRLAARFPHITRKLPQDFEPVDLIQMSQAIPLSPTERDMAQFLLHVWNRYDHPFQLDQVLGWDNNHLQVFLDWFSGKLFGEPVRYF